MTPSRFGRGVAESPLPDEKHIESRMFLRDMDQAYTDRYMSDQKLQADPRIRRVHEAEVALVKRYAAALPAGASVVDVPCGNGRLAEHVAERRDLRLVCFDYNAAMIHSMRAAGRDALLPRCARADILHLPLPDRAAHLLLTIRLLHHIPDDATRIAMLAEMRRVAAGPILTTFWNSHCWRHLKKRLRGKAVKLYPISPARFTRCCREAGLRVERLIPVHRWIDKHTLAVLHRV